MLGTTYHEDELTLSAPWAKSWSFAGGIDQDQTAENVQSDLDQCRPLVKSNIYGTIICGGLCGSYLLSSKEVGLKYLALKT